MNFLKRINEHGKLTTIESLFTEGGPVIEAMLTHNDDSRTDSFIVFMVNTDCMFEVESEFDLAELRDVGAFYALGNVGLNFEGVIDVEKHGTTQVIFASNGKELVQFALAGSDSAEAIIGAIEKEPEIEEVLKGYLDSACDEQRNRLTFAIYSGDAGSVH